MPPLCVGLLGCFGQGTWDMAGLPSPGRHRLLGLAREARNWGL
jgi:hypothetical protein